MPIQRKEKNKTKEEEIIKSIYLFIK